MVGALIAAVLPELMPRAVWVVMAAASCWSRLAGCPLDACNSAWAWAVASASSCAWSLGIYAGMATSACWLKVGSASNG